jgi:hypothetical protein
MDDQDIAYEMEQARAAVRREERRRLEAEGWDAGSAWIAVTLRFEGQPGAKWVAEEVERQRRGERPRFRE